MTVNEKRLEMKSCKMILTAPKVSALLSGKIDKYEYLIGEEILPPHQSVMIEQAKFTYSSLGKAFEEQIKTIENQSENQIKATEEHGKQLVKSSGENDPPTLLNQKKFFNKRAMKYRIEVNKLITII